MALVRDVTEKRRLERELQQREKVQSLGLLAGGVAHDLNNFLSVVQTNGASRPTSFGRSPGSRT